MRKRKKKRKNKRVAVTQIIFNFLRSRGENTMQNEELQFIDEITISHY